MCRRVRPASAKGGFGPAPGRAPRQRATVRRHTRSGGIMPPDGAFGRKCRLAIGSISAPQKDRIKSQDGRGIGPIIRRPAFPDLHPRNVSEGVMVMARNLRARVRRVEWVGTVALAIFAALALTPSGALAGQTAAKTATFTKDIAPIFQRSCQTCHRPDSVAPMSLLTYEDVRPWARAIKYRTGLRDKPDVMPPWFMEKNIGIQKYRNDISLTDEEVGKIASWVDAGAPRGNPADMPPPRSFPDPSKWQLGEPDLIVSSPIVEMAA